MEVVWRLLAKVFPSKKDDILFVEDNHSVADCIEEAIRKLDFDPKYKIKKISGCPILPWVTIDNNCYLINASKDKEVIDKEVFGFQIAFKFVRMRAQKENPDMVLFTPDISTGDPLIDEKISDSYFNNFDNKNQTDGAISSWFAVQLYIEGYPEEEIATLTKLGADAFLKFSISSKKIQ